MFLHCVDDHGSVLLSLRTHRERGQSSPDRKSEGLQVSVEVQMRVGVCDLGEPAAGLSEVLAVPGSWQSSDVVQVETACQIGEARGAVGQGVLGVFLAAD